MTRRTKRSSSHSLNSPPTSTAASRRRHHRKPTPKTSDSDYSDASQSQPKSIDIPPESQSEPNSPSPPFSPTNHIESSSSHRTPPYIPIAPLPIFHGGSNECALTHLSRFNKFCCANFSHPSTDLMMRIFPVTLENEAALWYDLNVDPYPTFTWEEIRSLFLQAYDQIELIDQLRTELTMIKQDRNESVRSYFLRLQWILKRWPEHGLEDNVIKGVFVGGLREEFRDWIVAEKPGSLNDALRLAFGLEQVRTIRIECGFCGGEGHEEKGCEVRERMRELWVKSKEEEEEEEEKELVIAVSGRRRSGEGEEEDGKKKRQCQCWKHQCWKKKLERSKSLVVSSSGNFNADEKF